MKCTCKRCCGTGNVTCPECDGDGALPADVRTYKIPENAKRYDDLVALQQDAQRITADAVKLRALRPERSGSYTEQEMATLATVTKQFEKLLHAK